MSNRMSTKAIEDSIIKQGDVDINHNALNFPLVYHEFLPTHYWGSLLKPSPEVHGAID